MTKENKELARQRMVDLVQGLLDEHAENIIEAHQKMDNSLSVNIRLTLKHEGGKLGLVSRISYATDQVKDHANDVVDFNQTVLDFEDKKRQTG